MWVIILGYGRSGSTWLEQAIAEKIDAKRLGEFFFLKDPNAMCSCGEQLRACDHWSPYLPLSESERINKIATTSNITDSSKSSYAAVRHLSALQKQNRHIVRPVICFRNPIRVLSSAQKGSNRLLRKGFEQEDRTHWSRFVITWPLSYLLAFVFCIRVRNKVIIVNFDDKRSIDACLNRFSSRQIGQRQAEHIIEGNRLINEGVKPWQQPSKFVVPSIRHCFAFMLTSPIYCLLLIIEKISRD